MTQREKTWVLVVGASAALLGAWWIASLIMGAFEARHEQLAKVRDEVEEKQGKLRRGTRAKAQIEAWKSRSLSSDPSRAQSAYRVWLDGLAIKAGLEARPSAQRNQRDLFVQHSFQVTGEAEMPRVIQFLHDFYNTGYLHRISNLTLNPQPDKKALQVSLKIDVLSLNAAPKDVDLKPPAAEKPLAQDVAAYSRTILGRNFFFPANNPPRIVSAGSQRGYPNKSLSFTVRASDPDKSDRLTYSLVSGLEGASIDARSGEVRWTPSKLGSDYELIVRVTDDGSPPKSVEEKVKISVVEPPLPVREDPFARDDPARDARVTALVGPPDNLQVWVTVLRGLGDQPRTLHLNEGHEISVGSFTGVVKEVRDDEAVFQLKDGRQVTVGRGQPLVPRNGSGL